MIREHWKTLVLVLIAFGGGYLLAPTKVKMETVTVEAVRNDKVTTKKETIAVDGSKTIDTVIVDKSVEEKAVVAVVEKREEIIPQPSVTISALATPLFPGNSMLPGEIAWGIQVQKRVWGMFSIGAFGLSNKTVGISIGVNL